MVIKISFENKSSDIIDIIIEPEAINFELGIGKSLEIELTYKPDQLDEKLDTVMEKGRMIIYQNRCAMKVYIDNELKYW